MMRVSVVVPVFNAEQFIADAVESAVRQPEVAEVLLVEDGSQDGSLAVCKRLHSEYERVRVLRHERGENHGAGESRNVGIRAARFEYVAFLDADDYFLPGRFDPAKRVFAREPGADGVYDAVGTDFQSEQMRKWWREELKRDELTTVRTDVDPESLFEVLVGGRNGWFCTDGIVVKRALFERVGLFDRSLRMCQDTEMWLRMALFGRLLPGSLDQAVAMRRLHGENRIFGGRDGMHQRYASKMYRSVWHRDASQMKLPQRRAVLRAIIVAEKGVVEQRRNDRWSRLGEWWSLLKLALGYPQAIAVPAYRNWCMQAFRLRGLKKRSWEFLNRLTLGR